MNGSAIRQLKRRFPARKKQLDLWEQHPERFLATLLTGNNLTAIGIGVLSTSLALEISVIMGWGKELTVFLSSLAASLVLIVGGEILPKTYGRLQSVKVSFYALPLVNFLTRFFSPLIKLLVRLAERFLNLLGKNEERESSFLQLAELRDVLRFRESIGVEPVAHQMLNNILRFGERRVSEVMIPRDRIFALDITLSQKEIISQIARQPYSRVPVYRRTIDNIAGIIYAKDLLIAWRNRELFLINDLLRPAYFIPEDLLINELFRNFRQGHYHLAIVNDRYKKPKGLVTIEDLVEEIVGEIYDERDNLGSSLS